MLSKRRAAMKNAYTKNHLHGLGEYEGAMKKIRNTRFSMKRSDMYNQTLNQPEPRRWQENVWGKVLLL